MFQKPGALQLIRTGWTTYQHSQDPATKGLAIGFLFGSVGLLVHAVGANTFIIVRIMEPFWLYVALVVRSSLSVKTDVAAEEVFGTQSAIDGRSANMVGRRIAGSHR